MDDLDLAQQHEEAHRAQALRQVQARQKATAPFIRLGIRVCLDCQSPISPQRVAANPQAVRCLGCQTEKETHER